jgi:hypothetical protein
MVSSLVAQTVEGTATVVRVKGAARYSVAGKWNPLKAGDVLKPGTVVQTGLDKGSYVDLVLNDDGSPAKVPSASDSGTSSSQENGAGAAGYRAQAEQNVVRVNENTALGIDKLTSQNTGADVVTETQLDLKQGRITGNVKKLTPASKYEIKIPNGVAGIRGTLFDISADGTVRVSVGSVVLAYVEPDGNVTTQVINANEQYDAKSKSLTPLPPGALDSLNVIGSQIRAGSTTSTTGQMTDDYTVQRVSPSKGKGKGPK